MALRARAGQAGFGLIELLIAATLLLIALGIACQLLEESALQLIDTQAEVADSVAPLLLDRLRGDVLASAGVSLCGEDQLFLVGHPAGNVYYQRIGNELHRSVFDAAGMLLGEGVPWRGVTSWSCTVMPAPVQLLRLDLTFSQRAWRRSLGAPMPGQRGPAQEPRAETLFLTPRGSGLGGAW